MNSGLFIDGNSLVARLWHGMPDDRARAGTAYVFARWIARVRERWQPTHIAVVFDREERRCFRHRLLPSYKANRPPRPEDLMWRLREARYIAENMLGPERVMVPDREYEADDVISTLVHLGGKRLDVGGVVVSDDKDLLQLTRSQDWVVQRCERDGKAIGANEVHQRFGVWPYQLADLLALAGDASDGIPGLDGWGMKTAARVLAAAGSVEEMLRRPELVGGFPRALTLRRTLLAGRAEVLNMKAVVALTDAAPIPVDFEDLRWPASEAFPDPRDVSLPMRCELREIS